MRMEVNWCCAAASSDSGGPFGTATGRRHD